MTTTLQTDNLEKRYPRGERPALRGFSLQIAAAEIAAVIGASGSGKTTLLRLLAGLEAPDSGEIWIAGQCVAAPGVWVPPERRGLGFVFQEAALFPHMSVAKNVAYGLRRGSGREARVAECLDLVGLAGFGQRYPAELSGGERQRVALARALAPSPRALLLDEPFSNLDPERRLHLRGEVQKILRAVGITAVIVTHDTEDALAIADRIAILREGHLAQQGSPRDVYENPADEYCARLFGPAARWPDGRWLRPGQIEVSASPSPGAVEGTIASIQFLGAMVAAEISPAEGMPGPVVAALPGGATPGKGDRVWLKAADSSA